MRLIALLLGMLNAGAAAVLLAIPVGRVAGFVHQELDAAALFGWLLFFVPSLAAFLALLFRRASSRPWHNNVMVVALIGSFLVAPLGVYTVLRGPEQFLTPGVAISLLFIANVLVLWPAFLAVLQETRRDND